MSNTVSISQTSGRQERRKQATRQRILDGAMSLFTERGYEAATVAEICARADVAHQTFFNHFPRKQDLLADIFRTGIDLLWSTLEDACREAPTTRGRIGWFFETWTQRTVGMGRHARDITVEIVRANQNTLVVEESRRVSDVFTALIERGLEIGDVTREHDPAVLAQLVQGAHHMLMQSWSENPDVDLVERGRQLANLVADAVERSP